MPTLESLFATVAGVPSPYGYITQPVETITPSGGTATMDNGAYNVFSLVIGSDTTIAHSNVPSTGTRHAFELHLTWVTGTITWPSEWTLGDATPTETGEYLISGVTLDGGTNWKIAVMATADIWTPSNITTALWLDAADSSTVTESSGAVSQWDDKSGNGNNFTQGTSANQPTYSTGEINGLPAIIFDGSDDFLGAASPVVPTTHSLFIVFKPTIESVSGGLLGQWESGQTGRFVLVTNRLCTGTDSAGQLNPFNSTATSGSCAPSGFANNVAIANEATLIESISTTGSENWKLLKNGTEWDSATITSVYQGTNTAIGRYSALTAISYYDGLVAEIVMLGEATSTDTRQRIEGYLAHKWGLTANLPSGHSYKTLPPLA